MNDDVRFPVEDWRTIATRTEPLPGGSLKIRILLIEHRRQPSRAVLLVEVFRRGDGERELVNLGGALCLALTVSEGTPEPSAAAEWNEMVTDVFDQAIERIRRGRP